MCDLELHRHRATDAKLPLMDTTTSRPSPVTLITGPVDPQPTQTRSIAPSETSSREERIAAHHTTLKRIRIPQLTHTPCSSWQLTTDYTEYTGRGHAGQHKTASWTSPFPNAQRFAIATIALNPQIHIFPPYLQRFPPNTCDCRHSGRTRLPHISSSCRPRAISSLHHPRQQA